MTRAEQNRLRWLVSGGAMLWMVLVGWLMVATLPEGAVENHSSSSLQTRMSDCTGSFRDRYQCKEELIVKSGQLSFYTVATRFLLVMVPPLIASFWLSSYVRRHPIVFEELRHASSDDWKSRAVMHTTVQSPEEAAEALHVSMDDLPPRHEKGHHLIDDIAPMDDWKTRAQHNVRGKK
jgi:hypothetical protein